MTRPSRGLTEGPITPTLIKFALPLLITISLHLIVGTWNAAWVSQVLGPNELIAVVNANVLSTIVMALLSGFGAAAGVFVGQSIGADDLHMMRKVVGTSTTLAVVAGIAIAALGIFGVEFIVDLLRMPAEVRASAITYFRIICLSMPTLFVFVFTTIILRSSGDAKTPSLFSAIWIGLGFILSPILLTGAFGLPALGIAGVAIGGWLANAIALLVLVLYIYAKNLPLALRGENLRYLRPDPTLLKEMVKRAIPSAAESLIINGSYFLLLSLVNAYGVATASAYSAAAQLWGYVQAPAMAMIGAMSAMAAQNIGAKRWQRVNQVALHGSLLGFSSTATMSLLVFALGSIPLQIFLPRGGEEIQIAMEINKIVLWCWPMIAISFGLFAVVRGNGAMLPPAIIFAISLLGLRYPFADQLQSVLGSAAIWWSFPLGTATSALLAFMYFRWGKWRQRDLLKTLRTDHEAEPGTTGN